MPLLGDTEPLPIPPPSLVPTTAGDARRPSMVTGPFGDPMSGVDISEPRRRSRWRAVRRWTLSVLLFALLAPPLLGLTLVLAIYRQARSDQARPVDAIVVLGTAQYNGRPGAVFEARLDRAIELFAAGDAPLIVVTGGRAPGDQFSEAEAAQGYLVDRGIPVDAILLENEGHNSWASMQGVAEMLQPLGARRILLVSDGFHLFRLKLMARDLGLVSYAAVATDSPIRPGGSKERGYVIREAGAVVAHLWHTRGPVGRD